MRNSFNDTGLFSPSSLPQQPMRNLYKKSPIQSTINYGINNNMPTGGPALNPTGNPNSGNPNNIPTGGPALNPTGNPNSGNPNNPPMGGASAPPTVGTVVTPSGTSEGGAALRPGVSGLQDLLIDNLSGSLANPVGFNSATKHTMKANALNAASASYNAGMTNVNEALASGGIGRGAAAYALKQRVGSDSNAQRVNALGNIDVQDAMAQINNENNTKNQILGLLSPWYGFKSAQAGAGAQVASAGIYADVQKEANAIDFYKYLGNSGSFSGYQ